MANEIQNVDNVISVPSRAIPYQKGVGSIIFEKMTEHKDTVAQIDGISGEKDTNESMLRRSVRTAITMRSRGITREDIVTVCSFNHLDTNIPIIASLFLGVQTASTDPTLSLSDTVYLLNQVRPKMIFVSPNGEKLIEDALQELGIIAEIVVFGDTSKHSKFSEFLKEVPGEKDFVPVEVTDINETAAIVFSSGTSGLPKGICLSHLSFLGQMPPKEQTETVANIVTLLYSTPYWISSLGFLINNFVMNGCRIVLPSFDASNIWSVIEKYQVLITFLSPSQTAAICSHGRPEGANTSSLKLMIVAGAPASIEHLDELRANFPETLVFGGYGQTEVAGGALNFKISDNPEDLRFILGKTSSCGQPQAGFSYKIVDLETEENLGPNQQGELRIKTEYQMNGYYKVDSSNAWDADGFLKSGDIAYYDEDYCFYIVDRIKDMLKFQSWQIAPAKLEALLMTHPSVESAVVIGIPHPADGDHPMGIVVLNKSGISVTPEEIEKYVEERVSDRQRLRGGVKIVEFIPVTPSGKYKKKCLKELALAGKL